MATDAGPSSAYVGYGSASLETTKSRLQFTTAVICEWRQRVKLRLMAASRYAGPRQDSVSRSGLTLKSSLSAVSISANNPEYLRGLPRAASRFKLIHGPVRTIGRCMLSWPLCEKTNVILDWSAQ